MSTIYTDNLQIIANMFNIIMKNKKVKVNYIVTEKENSINYPKTIMAKCDEFEIYLESDIDLEKIYNKNMTLVEFDKIVRRHIILINKNK